MSTYFSEIKISQLYVYNFSLKVISTRKEKRKGQRRQKRKERGRKEMRSKIKRKIQKKGKWGQRERKREREKRKKSLYLNTEGKQPITFILKAKAS